MAESSRFWTTSGTGDGASGGFTAAQFQEFMRHTLMTDTLSEGVLKGIGNELAVTGASASVNVASGSALVYGVFYANDAPINVPISTNTGGGTRIDRIVLRANLSPTTGTLPQTVRVAKIEGTPGGAAPGLTQSSTGTFEIPLANVSITTGNVITVSDQRTFVKTPGAYGYLDDANIIGATQISSGAVTEAKIGTGAVTADKIGSSAVIEAKIGTGAVTADKIGSSAVIEAKIGTGAVTEAKIGTGAVTSGKIGANAVVSGKIAADAVTTAAILNGTVTADKLVSSAVTEAKIATGAVTSGKIATGAVTGGTSGGVATGSIAVNTIVGGTSGNIALTTITADNIADNAVTEGKINAGAVTVNKIGAGAVTSAKLALNSVVTTSIVNDAITSDKIADNAVVTASINALAVTSAKLASASVAATNIIDDAVTGRKIGEYAIKFGGRQGGNSNDWPNPGTTRYDDPISSGVAQNEVSMASGSIQISISASSSGTANVTFYDKDAPVTAMYAANPIVIATPNGSTDYIIDVSAVSSTGATIRATHKAGTSTTTTVTVWWISIGPTTL